MLHKHPTRRPKWQLTQYEGPQVHNLLLKSYDCYVKRHSLGDKEHFNRVEVIIKQLNNHKLQFMTFGRENELAHDFKIGSGFTNFCRLHFLPLLKIIEY
jgi:hypothetical protein